MKDPFTERSQNELEQYWQGVQDATFARFTIWSRDGVAVFSDLHTMKGVRAEGRGNIEEALASERSFFVLREADIGFPIQTDVEDFLDIVIPLYASDGELLGVAQVHAVSAAILLPLEKALRDFSIVLIGGVVMITLLSIVAVRMLIVQPIGVLKNAMRVIRAGNFDYKIGITTNDEIGELTQHFQAMAEALKNREAQLQEANVKLAEGKEAVEQEVRVRTRELQEQRARLLAAIHSVPLGFIILDLKGNVVLKNPAALNILEIPEEAFSLEAITLRLGAAFDIGAFYKECLHDKVVLQQEAVYLNKFLRFFLNPVEIAGEQGEVIGLILLVQDITEEKILQRSKDDFVAIASHELRTPLAIIRGNAEVLMKLLASPSADEAVAKRLLAIHTSSIRLLGIVNDFLDLATLEAKRMQMKRETFSITELIQGMLPDFQDSVDRKGLSLKLENAPETPMVTADIEHSKQVITNIIGNAIQYTQQGGITISLQKTDGFVKVAVTDTGAGIAPELQPMLFRKFETVSERFIRSKEYGSGLGLYISRLIMERMGGKIILEKSVPGQGSTFSIHFPTA
jgi:two-component system sensor histidine kinase VicK